MKLEAIQSSLDFQSTKRTQQGAAGGASQASAEDATETALAKFRRTKLDLADEYSDTSQHYPWIVGYSGGKDSTLLLQLVAEMLMERAPNERPRPVHVICNDTRVESPVLSAYVDKMLARLKNAAKALELPITVHKTEPLLEQTFWVNLIGRGYPTPNRAFRWCTDRMKIQPTSNYIRQEVAENGEVILLLGVRKDESAARSGSINRYENTIRGRLNPHSDLKNCLVYRPITDFTTDEVWTLLLQRPPPWGGTHKELVTLYRNAQGGECPLVMDKSQAPSCGTSSSRFGCWTCTVVDKDHSMEGFIDAGFEHLEPLMKFRDFLAQHRNDPDKRMLERRNGKVQYFKNPQGDHAHVMGPYTLEFREVILDELLLTEKEVGQQLISEDEIALIKHIWAKDAARNVRRAPSLPIFEEDGT